LKLYLNNRWIRKHESSSDEIARLLAIADRDIQQCQTPGLGSEWRFDIAYNAVLQLATAALAACGYRAERQSKHMRTIECLAPSQQLSATGRNAELEFGGPSGSMSRMATRTFDV